MRAIIPVAGFGKRLKPHTYSTPKVLLNVGGKAIIGNIIDKLIAENSRIKGIPGYRIRIFSESGLGAKEQQQQMRARFLSEFPGIDAYHKYDEPFFKVYVGDCRTKSEVLKLYDEIKDKFPNPIIVPDYINQTSAE